MDIKWMRRGGQQTLTHAFGVRELIAFEVVVPLGQCDDFRTAGLVEDNTAAKCPRCQRAVERGQR